MMHNFNLHYTLPYKISLNFQQIKKIISVGKIKQKNISKDFVTFKLNNYSNKIITTLKFFTQLHIVGHFKKSSQKTLNYKF